MVRFMRGLALKREVEMAINNRKFIVLAKQYAVDDVVQTCINDLKSPRLQNRRILKAALMVKIYQRRARRQTCSNSRFAASSEVISPLS